MVSGINGGGIPPIGVPQGQQNTAATTPTEHAPTSPSRPGAVNIENRVANPGLIPGPLAGLVDSALSTENAKQAAANLSAALKGGTLSIANANPSATVALSTQ